MTTDLIARIHAAADAEQEALAVAVATAIPLPNVTDLLILDCGAYVTGTVTLGPVLEHRTRQGRSWVSAPLTGLDRAGAAVVLQVHPTVFNTHRGLLASGAVLSVTGRVDRRAGGLALTAHTINPIGELR